MSSRRAPRLICLRSTRVLRRVLRIPDGTSLLVTLKQAQPQQFTAARNNRVGVNVILDFL